jgi:Zn-dependent M28 family amino/carboxypeptidase
VPEGPGINDNGTGSAFNLELAIPLAKMAAPANKVRFAFWGAEEEGLLGSTE